MSSKEKNKFLFGEFLKNMITSRLSKYFLLFMNNVGVTLAVVISWIDNHSVLWAITHGAVSWLYVFFHLKEWLFFWIAVAILAYLLYGAIANVINLRRTFKAIQDVFGEK